MKKKAYKYFSSVLILLSLTNNAEAKCISGDCIDGNGVFKDHNGTYTGSFKNGKRHGWGHIYNDKGASYIGDFKAGLFHGIGKHYSGDGNEYQGEWVNGNITGYGVTTLGNDQIERYVGERIKGKQSGSGTYYYYDGDKYEGQWKDGKKSGFGVYTFKAEHNLNQKFAGYYENGKRHGGGIVFYEDGSSQSYIYSNGQRRKIEDTKKRKEVSGVVSYQQYLVKYRYKPSPDQKELLTEFGRPIRFNLIITDSEGSKKRRSETWYYDNHRTWFRFINGEFAESGPIEEPLENISPPAWSPTDFSHRLTPESAAILLIKEVSTRLDVGPDEAGTAETLTTVFSNGIMLGFGNGKLALVTVEPVE